MGQFVHVIRRNLNMTYIVMNNGCYGLTKGQDSATADEGSLSKSGSTNLFQGIDLVGLAIELGASFVGRSFSGDKSQLIPLIKAAMSHKGFAFLDVISPCVTFNNNVGSTKSYDYVRDHIDTLSMVDFVPHKTEITTEYNEGDSKTVELHDGSSLNLRKLTSGWDPTDRNSAIDQLYQAGNRGEILTGLIYIEPESTDLHTLIKTVKKPLNTLTEKELMPGLDALELINEEHR
jgi:2-oxoglutarate/2-oxoacid ferredoxin oxidoreductase subunit beta